MIGPLEIHDNTEKKFIYTLRPNSNRFHLRFITKKLLKRPPGVAEMAKENDVTVLTKRYI